MVGGDGGAIMNSGVDTLRTKLQFYPGLLSMAALWRGLRLAGGVLWVAYR